MPRFAYTIDSDGRKVRRTITASSESEARRQLAADGISPVSMFELSDGSIGVEAATPLKAALSKLEQSSDSIAKALDAYAAELPHGRTRRQLRHVAKDIHERRVEDALANESLPHREILWSVIADQAQHDDPATFLNSVLVAARKHSQHGRRLWQTFAYPLLMLALSLIVIWFLLMTVAPMQRDLVEGLDIQVPATTRLLLNANYSLTAMFFLLLAASISFYLIPPTTYDRALQWVPIVGRYRQCSALASFCRTTAVLLSAGVSRSIAIEHAGRMPGRPLLTAATSHLSASLASNSENEVTASTNTTANQTRPHPCYPLLSTVIYAVSDNVPEEKRGAMLLSLANTYHVRGQRLLRWIEMIFEPLLVLMLGAFIAFAFACLLHPLMKVVMGLA